MGVTGDLGIWHPGFFFSAPIIVVFGVTLGGSQGLKGREVPCSSLRLEKSQGMNQWVTKRRVIEHPNLGAWDPLPSLGTSTLSLTSSPEFP